MNRTKKSIDIAAYPDEFHAFLKDAQVFDSSCSPEARVIFIDKDGGYYLKSAEKGTLKKEAEMTKFFCSKGLGTKVIEYLSLDKDWLLTEKVLGEDCTDKRYLDDPKRLCDTIAMILRGLHEIDFSGCPIANRTEEYIKTANTNYKNGIYDASLFPDNWGFRSADEAWDVFCHGVGLLKNDTLIHGDYCLPNIMLNEWNFSKFIDLGNGGVGDRHIDIFWGAWTLNFNLKTEKYTDRFLDAYGRDQINTEMLRVVAAAEVFG